MSTDTERVEGETETSLLETWEDWYHVPLLGVVMLFMVWVRTQTFERFVTEDGTPQLAAIDSWYHWRTVQWTAENYPRTMPYEIWTGFPTGRYVGQFGTLFDQIIVTAAMILGLGNPSTETLYTVALVAVPVMAALVAIPVFVAGRRLGGTLGGLVAAVLLALAPGTFLYRTTAGQLQHHVAEVLFMAVAVLAMMVALRVAERDRPIYELVVERDWETLREPTRYSVLAGLALSLYIWAWPPGVVLIGILGVFFAVHLCLDYVRGVSPDHVAFVGVVSLAVTAVVTALLIEEWSTSVTSRGYLQPAAAFLVAVGCAFMAWLARQWNGVDVDRRYYPAAIVGLAVAGLAAMALVLPDLYGTLIGNLTGRVLPIDPEATTLTISEAQPPDDYTDHVFDEFGSAFFTMLLGIGVLVARPLLGREYRAEYTLVIVWALFLIGMSMSQVRFAYYLVLPVAVLSAAFVGEAIHLIDFDLERNLERPVDALRGIETYQVIVFVLVIMLLFAPLLPPIATTTAMDQGEAAAPSHNGVEWEEANHWLAENTPEPGDYGGAGNASDLDYYGSYEYPEDGDFDYPEGAYGVMSWWDYGHFITVQGERIPHANPFQQNAESASAYLTAQSEERAETILDAIGVGEFETGASTEELDDAVAAADDDPEENRYVMIDHEMAGGKFEPITRWTGPDHGEYLDTGQYQYGENQSYQLQTTGSDYYDTTLSSLYLQDANGMEHYRLVDETDDYAVVGGLAAPASQGELQGVPHRSIPLENLGIDPAWDNETAELESALMQSRLFGQLVQVPNVGQPTFFYDAQVTSKVKSFERVEGATIEGSVDDEAVIEDGNASVRASVELETAPGRTFQYTQDAELGEDGQFELTVPYATDDGLGPDDGYTDSSVEANGEYEVEVLVPDDGQSEARYGGALSVDETAVVEGESVEVSLEAVEDESDNESAGDEGDGADESTGQPDDEDAETGGANDDASGADESDAIEPIARPPA